MGLGNLVQKAVYLGIGVATYAGEKAGERLGELREQMQKMADEMVERGEMSAEEGRKFVDDMVRKAQQAAPGSTTSSSNASTSATPEVAPRPIEIQDDVDPVPAATVEANSPIDPPVTKTNPVQESAPDPVQDIDIDTMRRQVQELQEELRRLRRS
jgi:polyhydroxyalkanoate synthesis regulator phasin